nr:5-formyltetrahydrofolate cyclo-ligase [Desulfobacterales bacterium]
MAGRSSHTEDIKAIKSEIRRKVIAARNALSIEERIAKSAAIMERLFELANFLEAKTVLFYMNSGSEVITSDIIRKSIEFGKNIVLPSYNLEKSKIIPLKVQDPDRDLRPGFREILEPIPNRSKQIPFDQIDLAIVPGTAFDERGGRMGYGEGFYDRLIPCLEATTRKVALAFECQFVPQVPMESTDRYIDIIITEDRTIYKI